MSGMAFVIKCFDFSKKNHKNFFFSMQMFAKLPKTLVMSEPWALFYIHRLYKNGHVNWKEYQTLIETCVKLLFKPTKQVITER